MGLLALQRMHQQYLGSDTRVTANESSITSQASQTTAINASLSDLLYIQDEADSILETETGERIAVKPCDQCLNSDE
jgi:hypothetical protein